MKKNKLLTLLLLPLMMTLSSCNSSKESDEQYFSHFEPVIRFAVTSDAHISADKTQLHGLQRFKSVYDDTYNYAQTQTYKGFDHVFVVGDGADDGSDDSLNMFAKAIKDQGDKYLVETHAIIGNHELTDFTRPDYDTLVNAFKQALGYQAIDFHITINGFHFIMFSPRDIYWQYDEDNLGPWLEGEIQKALADDPSKTKPIFVFHHIGIKDTVYGSNVQYMERIVGEQRVPATVIPNILKKYPQVVDFSGHSHAVISDPRSVYQKDYTAITTGSLSYHVFDLKNVYDSHVFATDTYGRYSYSLIDFFFNDDARQFLIFETDKTGASKMIIRDADSHQQVGDPLYFRSFASPNNFRYTLDRANSDPLAEFDNVQVADPVVTADSVTYEIPHAKYAQNYCCDLYTEHGLYVDTVYRLSDSWLAPQPPVFQVNFYNLLANTNYYVQITPVNSWGKVGKHPLTLHFRTSVS